MDQGKTTSKSAAPDPLVGRVIGGRFKLTALIARGGMGKVYRAEQAPLGRVCAVKVLNTNYVGEGDPEFQRRFFREASITSKISHPNCVTIFDYGKTDDDIYFMAMEYLEGQTLHAALRKSGVMDEIRVGRIIAQVCRAVREAHQLGVIHRDLKPANIFLTRPNGVRRDATGSAAEPEEEDFVKVLDFGLVKSLRELPEEQLTQTGLFMGSPKYMAPEQIQGGHVDERTDIYSLGIIMYELLAGKVPFERPSSVNILMAHVGEPPPPMRAVNPNLVCSPAFEEIVMACIAKDPNARIASMDMLLQAIRRVHGGLATGQLAALGGSGAHAALHGSVTVGTVPPPPVMTSGVGVEGTGGRGVAPALLSQQVAAIGAGETDSHARRGAVPWLILGMLGAVLVGGGLGGLVYQLTTPVGGAPASAAAPAASSPNRAPEPRAEAAESRVAEPSPSSTPLELLAITTDPPGVAVREDGRDVCAATPCSVRFKEPSRARTLTFVLRGYRPETRTVRLGDPPLFVRLTRIIPQGKPNVPSVEAVPSGFKPAY
jgi:hypothetical protein